MKDQIVRQAGSIVYNAAKQESESTEEEGTSKHGCSSKQEVAKGDPHHTKQEVAEGDPHHAEIIQRAIDASAGRKTNSVKIEIDDYDL